MNGGLLCPSRVCGCVRPVLAAAALICTITGATGSEAGRASVTDSELPGIGEFPEAEVASRGQHQIRELKYSPWRKLCFTAGRDADAKLVCRTTISGAWDTGQVVIKVDLIEREGDPVARLQIMLPTGLYLPPGIKVAVDGGPPLQIPYVICLSNACFAGNVADSGLVRALESGRALVVEAVNPNLLTIAPSLPLAEFVRVHRGPPTQVLPPNLNVEQEGPQR